MKVCVYRGSGPTDAYGVRDWLERNGLTVEVRGENRLGLGGAIPMLDSWPTVWVAKDDEDEAKALLDVYEGPTLVHPAWQCEHCGETNAPTFGSCWSCGRDGPALAS